MRSDVAQHARGLVARIVAPVRRFGQGLTHAGIVVGLLFGVCALTPSLLPRTWLFQGLICGVTFAIGYLVGTVLTALAGRIGVPAPSERTQHRAWIVVWVLVLVTVPVILWLSSGWQQEIRVAVGLPRSARMSYVSVFLLATVVFVVLLGIGRLIARAYRASLGRLLRILPRVVARVLAAAVVAALVVGFATDVVYKGFVKVVDTSFSASDRVIGDAKAPLAADRSGSPASLVPWKSLGGNGRTFVSQSPSVAQIQRFTGRPAQVPIRVYAGLESAGSLHEQAELVLRELKRTRAFDRAVVAVATTTGRGWVDPELADPLEYIYGGDTAIAAIQYSYLPSWISLIVDRDRASEAGKELFETVHAYWSTLPPDRRPKLAVFGESLGAYGGGAAFSGAADLDRRTDAAMFAGPPNFTQPWRAMTDSRQPGSPERLPRYGDGRTFRFAADADEVGSSPPDAALVYLQHGSDPVVWWSPSLITQRPDWLDEPRAPDVLHQVHWFPVVTFWQITCDMVFALDPPAGHGHHYGPEIPAAWTAMLRPDGWTAADTASVAAR